MVLLALAPSLLAAATDAPAPEADARPAVRLVVKNAFNPEDAIFPQIVEGRLISDLADMETFRMVGARFGGEYLLTCTIKALNLETGPSYRVSKDAESNGQPESREQVSASMDLDMILASAEKSLYEGKLSVQASRAMEISIPHTMTLLNQELIDRAAQRIERMIRKKLPKKR